MNAPAKWRVLEPDALWPDEDQILLLRAATWDGASAIDAWRAWARRVPLDDAPGHSTRLLPLVLRTLKAGSVEFPDAERYRGLQRRTWTENQPQFHRLGTVLDALAADGIAPLLLKGPALLPFYENDSSLRPFYDVDLLVRRAHFDRAIAVLEGMGYTRRVDAPHRALLFDSENRQVNINRRALPLAQSETRDDPAFDRPGTLLLGERRVAVLDSTDLLACLCLNGLRGFTFPQTMWPADAFRLIEAAGSAIDWRRLLADAARDGTSRSLAAALLFLRGELQAPIPTEVLSGLESQMSPSLLRRIGNRVRRAWHRMF